MKVTMHQIVGAVSALNKLTRSDLSLRVSYQLSRLVGALNKELSFFSAEKEKIMARNHITISDGGLSGKDEDIASAGKAHNDLLQMEVEVDAERLNISLSEDISLSANDIFSLSPFVNFVE